MKPEEACSLCPGMIVHPTGMEARPTEGGSMEVRLHYRCPKCTQYWAGAWTGPKS